jgi:hypothetical protein
MHLFAYTHTADKIVKYGHAVKKRCLVWNILYKANSIIVKYHREVYKLLNIRNSGALKHDGENISHRFSSDASSTCLIHYFQNH